MPVTQYQYSLNGGETWINLATTGTSPATGAIKGLTPGHPYKVIVRDSDAAGISVNSQRATVTLTPTPTPTTVPGAPTLSSAIAGDGQATIAFAAPTSNSSDQPTSYEVSTDAGATWTQVTTSGSGPYTVPVTGLTNGTPYSIEVRAVDSAGDSSPSNSIQVTPQAPATVPGAPTLNAVTLGDSGATVVFAAPHIELKRSTDRLSGLHRCGRHVDAGDDQWVSPYTASVTGLTNGITYTVEVRAVDGSGDIGPSNSLQVTPAAPTAAAAPTITNGSGVSPDFEYIVTLSWTAGSDGGSPVIQWQYSQDSGAYTTLTNVTENNGTYQATFDSGTNTCVFDGNEPYTIEATNSVGTSVASNIYDGALEGDC